ncbi:hypothetical protein DFH09DRAFT_1320846 [Mycena vulgaris]|nr:hypothetical protein DFH09DRAFT_1320846 [Mycena vulgaris]
MSFERFAQGDGGPSSSASSGQSSASIATSPDDSFCVWTEKDRTAAKYLVKKLTFLHGAPSAVDVLAVAGLVSMRYELYSLLKHSGVFYALAIYNVLEKKFEGHSTQGAAHNSMLPIVLGLVTQYPSYFKVLLDEFDDARARLEGRIELLRLKVTAEDVLRARIAAQDRVLAAQDAWIAALKANQEPVDGKIGGLAWPKDEEDAYLQPVSHARSVVFCAIRSQMARLARDLLPRRCTTKAVPRGRPRKNPIATSLPVSSPASGAAATQQPTPQTPSSSSITLRSADVGDTNECPALTPELIAHFFQCFDRLPQVMNPIIRATSITMTIRTVSYQLYLLPSQSRALALCIIALSSLISFHEAVLGDGPRPKSFTDAEFFSSTQDVLSCGARRAGAYRALHGLALKAAGDSGAMLQVSNENAASCFLLDVLDQLDVCGISRPWASAYLSHARALAPTWRTSTLAPPDGGYWAGDLMAEALRATSSRKPILFSRDDQLLLCGPEPLSPEALLASLKRTTRKSPTAVIFSSMIPYFFHITCLSRELWETITGDRAHLGPVSEGAVIQFLASLSLMHAILSRLLALCDSALLLTADSSEPGFLLEGERVSLGRCASAIVLGFAGLALPLHRELESRALSLSIDIPGSSAHHQGRMRVLQNQACDMAALGARDLARIVPYLPPVHFPKWLPLRDCTLFALEQAEAVPVLSHECLRDLQTFAGEIGLVGYSLDLFSSPHNSSLVDRLAVQIHSSTREPQFFETESALGDMYFPVNQSWFDSAAVGAPMDFW